MIRAFIISVVLTGLCCGCIAARGGSEFEPANASLIRPGSTIQEVAAQLEGPPYQIWSRTDGTTWAHWLYFDVSYSAGGTRVNNEELTLEFDEGGGFTRVVSVRGEAAETVRSSR